MKIWKEQPANQEVEAVIAEYFQLLQNGKLDEATELISSEYDDWLDSLFVVWQDHYLIHEIPKDSSFDGKEWLNDLSWLKDLTIKPEMEWINDKYVWADFIYRDEPSGYVGEFCVKQIDEGYTVKRVIFKMA
ncbi:hypothetical protein [Chitinophaga tropicalis]|uniref:SnoaL-like domain-containing protein n=1 Tax=Chitinophaga tropicalis TaxID=2683588 RepID=A0A7K1U4M2_9BACT|nr:hypothetical protein [Chitinophaga tropicalis]MVT09302.1 hypothetical protein [Chitinophaga tropicalis]